MIICNLVYNLKLLESQALLLIRHVNVRYPRGGTGRAPVFIGQEFFYFFTWQ